MLDRPTDGDGRTITLEEALRSNRERLVLEVQNAEEDKSLLCKFVVSVFVILWCWYESLFSPEDLGLPWTVLVFVATFFLMPRPHEGWRRWARFSLAALLVATLFLTRHSEAGCLWTSKTRLVCESDLNADMRREK